MCTYDEDGLCVSVCEPKNPDIEEYLERLLVRGRKEITTDRYRLVLNAFCRILRSLGKNDDPRLIQEDDVYVALGAMDISRSSQESYSYIVRRWCRFFKNYDPNCVKILTNGETPNAKWISYSEFVTSMKAAKTKAEVLMLYLGGNYGLRRGEMAKIGVEDIKKGHMIIHGKGHGPQGKIRLVPLLGDTDPVIEMYMEYRRNMVQFCDVDESDGRLLVFRQMKVLKCYTPEYLGRRCKEIMNSAGVDGTAHSLRREFITTAYRSDAQIVDIMRIVGHTDPRQTAKYIESDLEYMRTTINLRNAYITKESMT